MAPTAARSGSDEQTCAACGAPAATTPDLLPDGGHRPAPPRCLPCRAARAALPEGLALAGGPTGVGAPERPQLGRVGRLDAFVMAVERWADHAEVHVALAGPALADEDVELGGRWEVVGADGEEVAGFLGGAGGTGRFLHGHAELPPIDHLPLPWSVRFHRRGQHVETTVAEVRQTVSLVPDVSGAELPSTSSDRCPCCGKEPAGDTGRLCDVCRDVLDAAVAAERATPPDATPMIHPVALDLGILEGGPASISTLARWPQWFELRWHVGADSTPNRQPPGGWTATDHRGRVHEGFQLGAAAGPAGRSGRVVFIGDLDPTSPTLRVVRQHGGTPVLDVDLSLR